MNITNLLTLFAAIASFVLGLLVYLRNPKKSLYISFGFFGLATSIWCFLNFIFWIIPNVFIFEAQYAFGALVILSGVAWIYNLSGNFSLTKKILLSVGILFAFVTPFLSGLFIKSLHVEGGTYSFSGGTLFNLYSVGINVIFVYLLITIIMGYIKNKGFVKKQFAFILLGIIGFGGVSMTVSFILPFFGIKLVAPLDAQSSLIFVGFSAYAIARHRLMDIRMVVARSLAYTILIAFMAGFYAASVLLIERIFFPSTLASFNLTQGIIRTILAVIMAFTFQPLRRWITRITDKIFFKNQYNAEELLDTLAHTIGSTIVLIELVYKTLDLLMSQMKITRGIFVILNESGTVYTAQASGYKESPEIKREDMEKLVHDSILIYDELEESSHYKTLLRKYDAAAAIPLKTENTVEGVLLLGEKASGDMFSEGDLKVFEIIAPEIAVAITNAKAFEKIEKFNVTLRQEVKKATSELERKNEQLRELDKAKDEFISMASHQLRTPLTAIKGYLSMLLEGDAGEIKVSQYDFVNEAFSGANRMVGLINDLLNVSRMETGRFFLDPVEVDMNKLVQEEVKQLENHAKEKKLYLKYESKGRIPHIWVDETKIRQVVMNFIDNAVYYTTEGGATITLESDKKNIIFQVTDTGIGVPKEAHKNLFTKFYRADNARHVRPDGTGLGIYLAKRVMDDHGGEIIFHSEEGKGSTFGFKLPIKSHLKMKRISAPMPSDSNSSPLVGELAAGVGVSPEELEKKVKAGLEKPLPENITVKELSTQAADQKYSVSVSAEIKEN